MICSKCQFPKNDGDFNWRNKAEGIRQKTCRECCKQQTRSHYAANKSYYIKKAKLRQNKVFEENCKLVLDYLQTHPCVDCPEDDPLVLQFDHVRGKKRKEVPNMLRDYPWSAIAEEIEKCEIRCANCHTRRTRMVLGCWKLSH